MYIAVTFEANEPIRNRIASAKYFSHHHLYTAPHDAREMAHFHSNTPTPCSHSQLESVVSTSRRLHRLFPTAFFPVQDKIAKNRSFWSTACTVLHLQQIYSKNQQSYVIYSSSSWQKIHISVYSCISQGERQGHLHEIFSKH